MNILQINSSARSSGSESTRLADAIVAKLQAANAGARLTRRDLASNPHPALDEPTLGALFTPADQRSAEQAARVALDDALIAQVQAADVLVIGAPMYNFGSSVQLKGWFDAIARAGVTFAYTATGPVGKLTGKKVYVAFARGGMSRDTPNDTQTPHLKMLLGFLGMTDVTFVYAEGMNMGPEAVAKAQSGANAEIEAALALKHPGQRRSAGKLQENAGTTRERKMTQELTTSDVTVRQAVEERVQQPRSVERLINGQFVMDGAGVKINRVLTQNLQARLDPFLMLDAFGSDKPGDYIAGFPEHPHRGFETISYMITGSMRHRDSAGNEGLITDGGVQWMTAGRGVAHSEMPEQTDGMMEGFQLWLNLAAKDKMSAPWYPDIPNTEIPPLHHRGGGNGASDRRRQPRRAGRGAACRHRTAVSRCRAAGQRQL